MIQDATKGSDFSRQEEERLKEVQQKVQAYKRATDRAIRDPHVWMKLEETVALRIAVIK